MPGAKTSIARLKVETQMTFISRSTIAVWMTLAAAGCQQHQPDVKVDALEKANAVLEGKIKDLEREIQWVRALDELNAIKRDSASFDPQDSKEYQPVDAPTGRMLLVLEKVVPYLDGFTVHLRIGNPSTATYAGMKGKVKWGRALDFNKDAEYNKLSEKEITVTDRLPAGSWTVVTFNVAPATADQIRRLVIEPKFDELLLSSR